jgi:hypothetical protein
MAEGKEVESFEMPLLIPVKSLDSVQSVDVHKEAQSENTNKPKY